MHGTVRMLLLAVGVLLMPMAALAQDLLFENSNFELGDMTNWTEVSGDAWSTAPTPSNGPFIGQNPPEGSWAAWSAVIATGVESYQGVIQSTAFTVPAGQDRVVFNIAGWSNEWHRVEVRFASDDSVVAMALMPSTTHVFTEQSVSGLSAYEGQDLYLQVIDENNNGDPGAANGWLAAGNSHWFTCRVAMVYWFLPARRIGLRWEAVPLGGRRCEAMPRT